MTVKELQSKLASYPEYFEVRYPDWEWGTWRPIDKVVDPKGVGLPDTVGLSQFDASD